MKPKNKLYLIAFFLLAGSTLLWSAKKVGTGKQVAIVDTAEINGIRYELRLDSKTATVIAADTANRYAGEVVIPANFKYKRKKYRVTNIGKGAFEECTELSSVIIPAGFDSISDGAFFACIGLESVVLPSTVSHIGNFAFSVCLKLTSLTIPAGVSSIGDGAFIGCAELAHIVVENGNPVYDSREGCNAIIETKSNKLIAGCKSSVIPNSITHIGKYAFAFGENLQTIRIPSSVTDIADSAFAMCRNLREVHIEDLGAWCQTIFHGIESNPLTYAGHLYMQGKEVTELTIPKDVPHISSYAFYGGKCLFNITVPDELATIGKDAFVGVANVAYQGSASGAPWGARQVNGFRDGNFLYSDMTISKLVACSRNATGSVIVEDIVKEIGDGAFAYCDSLTSIVIPEGVTRMGQRVFDSCTALRSVIWNAHNCKLDADEGGEVNPLFSGLGITEFTFGNNVEAIPEALCQGISTLTSVTLPENCKSVGIDAFYGCTGLTKPVYNKHVFAYMPVEHTGTYAIPEGIETIAGSAFYGCKGLTAVTIPASVKTIKKNAFRGTGLTSVTIPETVLSLDYGLTFYECNSLTTVYWNARNCTLEENKDGGYGPPFYNDSSITAFIFDERIESLPAAVCAGLNSITTIHIPNNTKSIGDYAFSRCTSLSSVHLPAKTSQVGYNAFYGCESLTEPLYNGFVFAFLPASYTGAYTIPSGIEAIAGGAFSGCTGLTAITIPADVTNIGNGAFSGCTAMTKVTIPEGITTIHEGGTFRRCTSLKTVEWNAKHCKIEKFSHDDVYNPPFSDLDNITTFLFGDSVEYITDALCWGLSGLTSISIPSSVTHIGDGAFHKCTGLTSLVIPNSVTHIGESAFIDCTGLTTVTIPESVTSIGKGATFQRCSALTTVRWNAIDCKIETIDEEGRYYPPFIYINTITKFTFGKNVVRIPADLCCGLGGLKSVTIPSSVRFIENMAFDDCTALTSIYLKGSTPPVTANNAFYNISSDATFYVPEKSFKTYKNTRPWKDMNLKKQPKKK